MRPSFLLAAPLLLAAVPAAAQVGAYPTATQSDADRLAAAIRRVGASPRDLNALVEAGELSVKVGDATAAAALFKRAEQIDPNNGRVKGGIARILVNGEHPGEALRYFALAERAGLVMAPYAADRGLAYDLIGEQERAQRDYRLALRQSDDDEVRRRYALSLGIAGKQAEALQEIDALLRKSDRGAWRARAFILAMNGDVAGANRIATSMMPAGMASGMAAYFQRLPTLGAADRAFAVHFGEVTPTPTRLADARLAPVLPPLGPDPYAPRAVQVAAAAPAATGAATGAGTAPQPVDRRRGRDRRRTSAPVQTAARTAPAASVPTPVRSTPTPTPASTAPVQTAAVTAPAPATSYARPGYTPTPLTATPVRTPAPTAVASTSPRAPATFTPATASPATVPVVTGQSTGGAGIVPARTVPATTAPPPTAAAAVAPSQPVPRPGVSSPAAPVSTTLPREASAVPALASAQQAAVAPISTAATPIPGVVPAVTATPTPAPKPAAAATATRPANPAPTDNESILARIVAGIVVPPSELATAPVPPARPATASGSLDRAARRAESRTGAVQAAAREEEPSARPLTAAQRRAAAARTAAAKEEEAPKPLTAAERRAKAQADRKAKEEAAAKKALAAKEAAEKKAAKAEPARYWVQVAGGANARDLGRAWSDVQKKSPALAGKTAYTTPLRSTNRVVTGPYKTEAEARAMVNTLAKQGLSAFTFASEAGQKMTKLGGK